MKQDEKEKMMNDILSHSHSYSNIYDDSLDIVKTAESELNRILQANNDTLEQMKKDFNYTDADLNLLKSEIEKDFNVKIDSPETIVVGRASKEIFDQILVDLKEKIVGEDKACEAMTIALRRPYVTGSDPQKIRNTIILYGLNGTGRHQLVKESAALLNKYGLTVSGGCSVLDMSRYQSSSQEILFLQDLYVALSAKDPIILIENFAEASPIYNRMLAELSMDGKCVLNKRYTFQNNQLQEATSKLAKDIIDHFSGNDKILVFLSQSNPTKLMDIFGKSFIDNVADRVSTEKLSDSSVNVILDNLIKDLVERCASQLEIAVKVKDGVREYIRSSYEPSDGIDSLTPVIEKIYNSLVNVVLQRDDLKELSLDYIDEDVHVLYQEEKIDLDVNVDSSSEREEIQKELDDIVGLKDVKNYLLSLENLIKVTQIRKQKGLKTSDVSKHMIFTGNPGTGKTTIARIVSRMMKVCGILKQGQLVEVTRADLVGKYVGHTAPLTMDVINSALGGVLFIDEAYSLYRGKDDSFGLEAIDTIVKAMEDHRDDLIVILAGYTKEMETFLTANSGLKSRFANIIQFDDYTGEELMLIAKSVAKGKDYRIEEKAEQPLVEYFAAIQAQNDPNAGNGRLARNKVEEAILKQSKRLLEDENAEMDLLLLEDFNLTKE